jgi:uncharacterized membrane protein
MKVLTISLSAAITCSRDGAAFAEGLVWLTKWLTIFVGIVFAIALLSGIVIGARKGRERFWRQIGLHLAGAVAFLVIGALIGHLYLDRSYSRAVEEGRQEYAILDAWVAPIRNPVPGELDRALAAVVDADIANDPGRRGQLISFLPDHLEKLDSPLNDKERRALIDLAARLRLEDAQHGTRPRDESFDRIDGAVAWLLEKPDLPAALQTCAGRKPCTGAVLQFAEHWCKRQPAECRSGFTIERLNAAWELVKADQSAMWHLESIRHQARGIPAGPVRSPWPTPHS